MPSLLQHQLSLQPKQFFQLHQLPLPTQPQSLTQHTLLQLQLHTLPTQHHSWEPLHWPLQSLMLLTQPHWLTLNQHHCWEPLHLATTPHTLTKFVNAMKKLSDLSVSALHRNFSCYYHWMDWMNEIDCFLDKCFCTIHFFVKLLSLPLKSKEKS